ncbi:FG-GAP-like repeat-containing protein [Myxococcota bacterium]|nr:FG-GAP-like repeat-containing protein [Myxococcota bacterium]
MATRWAWALLLAILLGCGDREGADGDSTAKDDGSGDVDGDHDGFRGSEDCDDADPAVHPGAAEVCNGLDDDCDGTSDEDAEDAIPWYPDADGDGYGVDEGAVVACFPPHGTTDDGGDCDDTRIDIHPGIDEDESCDGTDQDCDSRDDGCALLGTFSAAAADVIFDGGASSFSSGDVDGDGRVEVLLGFNAEFYDNGAVLVISADVRGSFYADDVQGVMIGDTQSRAGEALDAHADLTGDGIADIVYGGPDMSYDADIGHMGAVYLTPGAAALGSYDEPLGPDRFALGDEDVRPIGNEVLVADVTGDGEYDVVVAADLAIEGTGTVLVYEGPHGSEVRYSADASARLDGRAGSQDEAGCSLATGDMDGDGLADLVVGGCETGRGRPGRVHVVFAPITGHTSLDDTGILLDGMDWYDRAASHLDAGFDVNGDGFEDLVVEANGAEDDHGAAYVHFGPLTEDRDMADADAVLVGHEKGDGAGYNVASAGDVDGDGFDDLLVAAYASALPGTLGIVYLVYGPVSGVVDLGTVDTVIAAEGDYGGFGINLAGLGDVNADGLDDFAIAGWDVGRNYIFYGRPRP